MKLPVMTETEKRLRDAVYRACHLFLQRHMLTLSFLPKVFGTGNATATPQTIEIPKPPPSPTSTIDSQLSDTSTVEVKRSAHELRAMLTVLREQREQVAGFLLEANERRRFEDVHTLQLSMDELDVEIARIRGELRGL